MSIEAVEARIRDSGYADATIDDIIRVGLRVDRGAVGGCTPTEDVGRAHTLRLSAVGALPATPAISRTRPGVAATACLTRVWLTVILYPGSTASSSAAASDDD
ncbi:MAG TPA: hypothetical protein DCQ04_00720 [Actinobacteria bacterium]|nr:hypothetical protein [Actinomycetota bacterium]